MEGEEAQLIMFGYATEARGIERALREVDDYLVLVAERETEQIEASESPMAGGSEE